MHYKYKNFLQTVFSALPKGERLNYVFQRYVTKNLPLGDKRFIEWSDRAKMHVNAFHAHHKITTPDNSYYEFGAGWDLLNPLAIHFLGFKKLIVIDIRRLIYPKLIQNTLDRFAGLRGQLPFSVDALPAERLTQKNCVDILQNYFGLIYQAPKDARDTGLPVDNIDFAVSNMTFEHIPQKDILPILTECYRLLKPGGILSATIDYRDHWAYFDNSISCFNYLRFSEQDWKKYNPDLHFQNRLRHIDYIKATKAAGFEVIAENLVYPTETELQALKDLPLAAEFSGYSIDELKIKESHVVLRKPV